MKHLQILIGGVEPLRTGERIAAWVVDRTAALPGLTVELLDLRDWQAPRQVRLVPIGAYANGVARPLARKIAEADGYVLIVPRFDADRPGALQAALDAMKGTAPAKPVMIVSYGPEDQMPGLSELRALLKGIGLRAGDDDLHLRLPLEAGTGAEWLPPPTELFAQLSSRLCRAILFRLKIRDRRWS